MTSLHTAVVRWSRQEQPFANSRYSRAHEWRFDGGAVVPASASPHAVRAPFSDPACVDPEEALIAAASSCHMLWFLSLAAAAGYVVDAYEDAAEGTLGDMGGGKTGIARIVLRPFVRFSGEKIPDSPAVDGLHHAAHERCDIANSLKGQIDVSGTWSHPSAAR